MNKTRYIIGAVVVIALAFWYLYPLNSSVDTVPPETVTQTPASAGNTTAEISAEFEQIADDTAELNQAAASSAQDVQGL